MEIVCLGELILDMFASEPGRDFTAVSAFIPVAGGAPANVAVAASRLGAMSAFIGKVGDDQFGKRLQSVLSGYGVETRGMRFDARARTTLNFMTIPEPNRTEMLFYRNPGADMLLEAGELDRGLIAEAAVYHFGSVSLAVEPCRTAALEGARLARAGGALVSLDVNYRPSLWDSESGARDEVDRALAMVDMLKVNEAELRLLAGTGDAIAGCRGLVERGPALCVATLGPHGSAWATRTHAGAVPGFAVEVVEATGCGDAFMAALLVRLLAVVGAAGGVGIAAGRRARLEALDRDSLIDALRWANAAGALTARRKGVMPALPDEREIRQLLEGA